MLPPAIGYELIDSSDVGLRLASPLLLERILRILTSPATSIQWGRSMTKKRPAQDEKNNGYRQILLKQKASALAGLGAQTHYLARAERICEEDQAQNSLDEAVSLRLNGHEYVQLRQIQEALDRLQLGEYGVCLACE